MQLALSTWQEIEHYLKQSTGIIIPIGSTEQHGPNGLIGTDTICPVRIAGDISGRERILIAPAIAYGMSQHHMAFPGTVTLRPATLIQVVIDVVSSLHRHGFTHFYFVNGHGGNIAPVTAAFSEIYAAIQGNASHPLRCKLANWWRNDAITSLARELYGDAEGYHATVSEVSLSYFAHPEAVKDVAIAPVVAPTGDIYDAADFRRQFPDGRMGSSPQLASIDAGERFCKLAVDALTADYHQFLAS
ncbi:MAG: amidase [Zetaproteobacteria bacterium CG12_big_fil_rev_8_21_14_0_65_54_13]|nr:MAG: amidase [Zetaproteobacteria bacterium CG23_combo_of_CG06-09_8_20_14_all_54_7]PIW44473.1 MAG: amidase [Zetaproteobacteria bacterium CG12_big_fil_rev_8_21_14_0_65_54_13]PIX55628.1 MAG: amidase [Zetaproteobacteria bacterium CG_4_10_14_3_um_filter_54_28]PJA27754.1 MAG: amidase [Zetaproteobacteria bacterium CG_4_9_14_3_um_filter_54_145]